jgi:serine/threonine-protein kinase HipA
MNPSNAQNREELDKCPGTLRKGHNSYSSTCLKKVFNGKKVSPFLHYSSPSSNEISDELFDDDRKRISISGVQGPHILKPIPSSG